MNETPQIGNSVLLQSQFLSQSENDNEGIDFVNILIQCFRHWYWFVLCAIIALVLAFFKVKSQENVYTRSATIMIKEEATGGQSSKLGVEADMGIFKSTSTVQNEIIAMRSPQVISDVVKRLKLYMGYSKDGRFHKETLYGWNLPVEVILDDPEKEQWSSFTLELKDDGTIKLFDFSTGKSKEIQAKLNERVSTPVGDLTIIPTTSYQSQNTKIYVTHGFVSSTTAECTSKLSVSRRGDKSSVIDLSYIDVSTQRAEDFLNTLIKVYSEYWVNDRNQIALSTNKFISERIAVIEKELGNVDSDISTYKSQNLIPNLPGNIGQNMSEAASANKETLELSTQLSMVEFLKTYLAEHPDLTMLIPAVSGIDAGVIEGQISNYNSLVLERNSLLAHSSEVNPLVVEKDEQLKVLRDAINSTISNQIEALKTKLNAQKKSEQNAIGKMAVNPEQEKYLLSVERQQSVKEALYTYLLQKREENELSQAFTAYNTRLINPPSGGFTPIAPNKNQIYMMYLAIGLAIPLCIIILLEMLNNTVRGRADLENMKTPFLGEIPFVTVGSKSFIERLYTSKNLFQYIKNEPFIMNLLMKLGIWKKSDRQSDQNLKLYVKPGSRNQINEAFRVVRSNMEFMAGESENQVIMVTSANAGSGKTFISLNLAASFAIKGRKVLAIDMDFRKRSLSKYVQKPLIGIADYLAKRTENYNDLIIEESFIDNMDILPVGTIPPNPTELLYDKRLGAMLDDLKQKYDLIFLDCPPIEIVADSSIIAKYADKSIFLVRAGLLQRNMLPEIDKFYDTKKFGNLCVLLNGTDDSYGKYGYSKYGYRYGYHYGYGGHYESEN